MAGRRSGEAGSLRGLAAHIEYRLFGAQDKAPRDGGEDEPKRHYHPGAPEGVGLLLLEEQHEPVHLPCGANHGHCVREVNRVTCLRCRASRAFKYDAVRIRQRKAA